MDDKDDSSGPDTAQEFEAVRERVGLIMREEGLSLASVSRQSGVSASVVSPFMAGARPRVGRACVGSPAGSCAP